MFIIKYFKFCSFVPVARIFAPNENNFSTSITIMPVAQLG